MVANPEDRFSRDVVHNIVDFSQTFAEWIQNQTEQEKNTLYKGITQPAILKKG